MTPHASRAAHPAVRLLLLGLALAGLFAMHGMSDHGTGTPERTVVASAPAAGHGHAHEGRAPVVDAPGEQTGAAGGSAGGHHGSLVELCLAVLVGGALLLLVLLTHRGPARTPGTLLAPARRTALGLRSRLRAPPDLHVLSVLRC